MSQKVATAPVLLAEDVGRVRVITLNRPDKLNAFNNALLEALVIAAKAAAEDDGVHVVVITGAGRAFSTGADLSDLSQSVTDGTRPAEAEESHFDRLQTLLEAFPKPMIGAVNGLGVGLGFTILGYFDFCYVADSARLRTPFGQLGLSPEASSSYTFPLRMGWAAAARALMVGEWFSAQDVVDAGLAQARVADDQLMAVVMAFAAKVAECPLQSLVATKGLMLQAHLPHLRAVRAQERSTLRGLIGTPANLEALKAFATRRGGG
jgi:enoyl-CoA hydratase/carnithine racemase